MMRTTEAASDHEIERKVEAKGEAVAVDQERGGV
jgi:hypothetical protein